MKRIRLETSNVNSKNSINSLPHEAFLEIFQYLDVNSLKAALCVSQRWSIIIKSASALTKNLEIQFYSACRGDSHSLVPIDGLMYRKLHLKGFISNNDPVLQDISQKYGQNIHEVVLDNICYGHFDLFQQLPYINAVKAIGHFVSKSINCLSELTTLELRAFSLNEILINPEDFKPKLKTLRIKIHSNDPDDEKSSKLHEFIINQHDELEYLSLIGSSMDIGCYGDFSTLGSLRKIELDLNNLEEIQLHSILRTRKFKKLTFLNPKPSQRKLIEEIIAEHKALTTLKIKCSYPGSALPSTMYFFNEIQNFKYCKFQLHNLESGNIFEGIQELSINRLDNESHVRKLIKFLKFAPNVIKLELNSVSHRARVDKYIREILSINRNLLELHIDAYSDKFDISSDTFEIIKRTSTKLKRMIIQVGIKNVETIRARSKILFGTQVQVIVMEKVIKITCLENQSSIESQNDRTCTFEL